MGVAGDMLCASLLDTLNEKDKEYIINKLNTLLCDVTVSLNTTTKSGIKASKFDVKIKKADTLTRAYPKYTTLLTVLTFRKRSKKMQRLFTN